MNIFTALALVISSRSSTDQSTKHDHVSVVHASHDISHTRVCRQQWWSSRPHQYQSRAVAVHSYTLKGLVISVHARGHAIFTCARRAHSTVCIAPLA
jgi:hypothetical protein